MLMETDSNKLRHRNAFNVTSMSFAPEEIASEIKKHIPDFRFEYSINGKLQKIADSWPDSIDDSCARSEWGWDPEYNLEKMTEDMLAKLKTKFKKVG
jgi:nucleoside-diphosphate-sugar epimerase